MDRSNGRYPGGHCREPGDCWNGTTLEPAARGPDRLGLCGGCLPGFAGVEPTSARSGKLFQLLAADVLWVDLFSVGALWVCLLGVWVVNHRHWLSQDVLFYVTFAAVASVAVPALGLFLVFASLIAPALWIEKGVKPWIATALTSGVSLAGLLGSWLLDTPSGPTVVLTLSVLGVCALFYRQNESPHAAQQASGAARVFMALAGYASGEAVYIQVHRHFFERVRRMRSQR